MPIRYDIELSAPNYSLLVNYMPPAKDEKGKKKISRILIEVTKHESKVFLIALTIQSAIIEWFKEKSPWLKNEFSRFPMLEHGLSTFAAAYALAIFETWIIIKIKSNIFFISRRTAIIFSILIVIVGFINTALAFHNHMSGLEIVEHAALLALSAVAVWMAPKIREDKRFFKSLMVTIPAASLGIAVALAGSLILDSLTHEDTKPPVVIIDHNITENNDFQEPGNISTQNKEKTGNYSEPNDQDIINRNAHGYIPSNYYSSLPPTHVGSLKELNRFIMAARNNTVKFDNLKRVAFLEWYLKSHGFNVSFVQSNNFHYPSQVHFWLVSHITQDQEIPIEPRVNEFGADNILPISPKYKSYEKEFKDIYELSKNTGGTYVYSWWDDANGSTLLNRT
jgi:hypothetical protein